MSESFNEEGVPVTPDDKLLPSIAGVGSSSEIPDGEPSEDFFNEEALSALHNKDEGRDLARVSHPSLLFVLTAMLALCAVAAYWCAFGTINYKVTAQGVVFPFDKPVGVSTPVDGVVEHILTSHGAAVKKGDDLLEIRVDEGDRAAAPDGGQKPIRRTHVTAPRDGIVLTYRAEEDEFKTGDNIVWLLPEETAQTRHEMLVYVTFDDLRSLKEGQMVQATPADLQREDCGYAYGKILSIDPYPTDRDEVASRLKLTPLASFIGDGAVYEVKVLLDNAGSDGSALRWSRQKSSNLSMGTGTLCNVQIITGKKRVWEVLVGSVSDVVDELSEE